MSTLALAASWWSARAGVNPGEQAGLGVLLTGGVLFVPRALYRNLLLGPFPVMAIPKGFLIQPIDSGEVANRLVELALSDPAGRVSDVVGPEVRTAAELARLPPSDR